MLLPAEALARTRTRTYLRSYIRYLHQPYLRPTVQIWTVKPAPRFILADTIGTRDSTYVNQLGQTWKVILRPMPPVPATTPYDEVLISQGQATSHEFGSEMPNYRVVATHRVVATAYNSRRNQTDNTPWRTASNRLVRDGDIACNFLPLGTLVRITTGPDIVRGKIFRVEDRLASPPPLGWNQIDVWMLHYSDAIAFKKQTLTLQVLGDPIGEAPH